MKKILSVFLVLGVFAVQFAVAGGSQENKSAAAKPVTLRWLTHPAYSPSGTDPNRVAYLKATLAKWESQHPNVTVRNELLSTNENEAMAKLLESAAAHQAPDVAQIDSFVFTRYMPYLQPLDSLMAKYGLKKSDFFDFAQKLTTGSNGKMYGLQFTTDARVLYYRKDLVPTPPTTWQGVMNLSAKLKAEGYVPIIMPAGRAEGASMTSIEPFFWGQGGKLVDSSGKPVFGLEPNKQYLINEFTFVKSLVDSGYMPSRAANYGSESDLNTEVATGKVAMFMGGNWQANQLKSIIGADQLAKWDVAPIPGRTASDRATADGGWVWGIFTPDATKQNLAFSLVDTLYVGDPGMAKWCTIAGYLPTRKSVYESPDFGKTRFTTAFEKIVNEYGHLRPVAAAYPKISVQLQIALSSVVSGSKSPTQAVDDAWAAVTQ